MLRRSTIVLDVRGNYGGNSAWAEEVAKAIWGAELVQWVSGSFDETGHRRASDRNIEYVTTIPWSARLPREQQMPPNTTVARLRP